MDKVAALEVSPAADERYSLSRVAAMVARQSNGRSPAAMSTGPCTPPRSSLSPAIPSAPAPAASFSHRPIQNKTAALFPWGEQEFIDEPRERVINECGVFGGEVFDDEALKRGQGDA
jgi:hypothetical protein